MRLATTTVVLLGVMTSQPLNPSLLLGPTLAHPTVIIHNNGVTKVAAPEAIPQMTNTSVCEAKDMLNWVCRDGSTITAAHSGKLYMLRLGQDDLPFFLLGGDLCRRYEALGWRERIIFQALQRRWDTKRKREALDLANTNNIS